MEEDKEEGIKDEVSKVGKSVLAKTAFWSFLIGVLIALIAGLVWGSGAIDVSDSLWAYIATTLAVLGFFVGLLSAFGLGTIKPQEVTRFLIAGVAIVVVGAGASALVDIPFVGVYLAGITLYMLVFFAPAMVIIALKSLWDLGKE
ncbi:MAG: hypothetical protein KAI64_07535 [Thermoplasmata archaeon]|nr:hypothetical protein [Thermoplasmata archaeon]